jgi:hypothetical protein
MVLRENCMISLSPQTVQSCHCIPSRAARDQQQHTTRSPGSTSAPNLRASSTRARRTSVFGDQECEHVSHIEAPGPTSAQFFFAPSKLKEIGVDQLTLCSLITSPVMSPDVAPTIHHAVLPPLSKSPVASRPWPHVAKIAASQPWPQPRVHQLAHSGTCKCRTIVSSDVASRRMRHRPWPQCTTRDERAVCVSLVSHGRQWVVGHPMEDSSGGVCW